MSRKCKLVLKHFKQAIFYSLVFFLTSSCEEDSQILGIKLIPDKDKAYAQYIDTFTVFAHTEIIDSRYTGYNSVVPIGNYHDPIFGFVKANLLTEYYPTSSSVTGSAPVLDSIILSLYPSGYQGDSVSDMKMNIYKYLVELPDDSLLYSDFMPDETNLEKVGEGQYTPNQESIEIFLDNTFGNELLSPEGYERNTVYDSIELFNELFPGIYIETEEVNSKGGMNYFRAYSTTSGLNTISYVFISLHYHYTENDTTKNGSLMYRVGNTYGAYKNISLFEHDYSKALFDPYNKGQDSVIYLQSLSGTKGVLQVPGLNNVFSPNSVSINSAKLILPIEDFDKSRYIFPLSSYVGIRAIDENNSEYILVDYNYQSSGGTYLDGGYVQDSLYYELNITSHIKSIINKENENLGFNIYAANEDLRYNIQSLNRMVLTSHQNSNPIKLQVIYTKLAN